MKVVVDDGSLKAKLIKEILTENGEEFKIVKFGKGGDVRIDGWIGDDKDMLMIISVVAKQFGDEVLIPDLDVSCDDLARIEKCVGVKVSIPFKGINVEKIYEKLYGRNKVMFKKNSEEWRWT